MTWNWLPHMEPPLLSLIKLKTLASNRHAHARMTRSRAHTKVTTTMDQQCVSLNRHSTATHWHAHKLTSNVFAAKKNKRPHKWPDSERKCLPAHRLTGGVGGFGGASTH